MGCIDIDTIDIEPVNWRQQIAPFEEPPESLSVSWPDVRVLDEQSCSACQSTLLMFLKRYGDSLFEYFPRGKEIVIAIGKGHKELPYGTLCIGSCTARVRKDNPFVSGCPPVASQIFDVVQQQAKKKR